MDNSPEFRSIELCAGYAGISQGLKRVIPNFRTVAYVEIEAFANANLVAKMEAGQLDVAPIWTNLKTFNAKPFRNRIHSITGGYPCQPFSAAGKREGKNDPRHLWPNIRKIVKTIRPVFCYFENVEGHLSLGFKEVQQSLRNLGYTVEAGIFSAAECGAPQQRKRVFILAYNMRYGCGGILRETGQRENGAEFRPDTDRESLGNGRDGATCSELADTISSEWRPKPEEANEHDRDDRGREEKNGGFELCCEELAKPGSVRSWPSRPGSNKGQERKSGKSHNSCQELGNSESDNEWGKSIAAMHWEGFTPRRSSWPSRPGEQQHEWEPPRVVANSVSLREPQPEGSEQNEWGRTVNEGENVGGSEMLGRQEPRQEQGHSPKSPSGRKTKPPVGRNSNGCQNRLDNAELYQSCDNRTDELRLLGNGVVPDTAEKAFIVLLNKIFLTK